MTMLNETNLFKGGAMKKVVKIGVSLFAMTALWASGAYCAGGPEPAAPAKADRPRICLVPTASVPRKSPIHTCSTPEIL